MGDWNVEMSDHSDSDYQSMRELINEESLKLIETGPTHHSRAKDTWIDLLLVDHSDVVRDVVRKVCLRHLRADTTLSVCRLKQIIPLPLPATISYRKYSSKICSAGRVP